MNGESSLLIYNLFIAAPEATEARFAFAEYVVEYVLFYSSKALTSEEVYLKLLGYFPNPISLKLIETALENVAVRNDEGNGEKYSLNEDRKRTFNLSIEKYTTDKDAFHNSLICKVEESVSRELTSNEKKKLCEVVENFITTVFSDKYKTIEHAMNQRGSIDLTRLEEKEYDNILNDTIKKALPGLQNSEDDLIKNGAIKTLKRLDENGAKYITSIFHKVFLFFYLNQEPGEITSQIDSLRKRKIYLDANIILGLIFVSQGRQKEIVPIIDQCKRHGIQLLITPCTLKEIEGQFEYAKKTFKGSGNVWADIKSIDRVQDKRSSVIIDDYLNEKISNKSLLWEVYVQSFLPMKEYLSKRFGIKLDTDEWPSAKFENIPDIDSIRNAIKDKKEAYRESRRKENEAIRLVSDDSLSCDSQNIYFVQHLRKKFQTDDMGIKVWLLTHDKPLIKSETVFRHLFPIPACLTVAQFADFLLPFSMTSMQEISHNQFVASLLSTDLGAIVEDENYIDINFYKNIVNSGVPLENIIALSDDRYTRKVLVSFQENKKVRELVKELNKVENVEDKQIFVKELQENIIKIKDIQLTDMATIGALVAKVNKLEIENASWQSKSDSAFWGSVFNVFKDKIKLSAHVCADLFAMVLVIFLINFAHNRLLGNTENIVVKLIIWLSEAATVIYFGINIFIEIKKKVRDAIKRTVLS